MWKYETWIDLKIIPKFSEDKKDLKIADVSEYTSSTTGWSRIKPDCRNILMPIPK